MVRDLEMETWKDREARGEREDDGETTRLERDYEDSEQDEDDESDESDGYGVRASRKGVKGTLWTVLAVLSMLAGRKALTSGFPYPFYFVFLLQAIAYCVVAVMVFFISIFHCIKRRPRAKERLSWRETFLLALKIPIASTLSGIAMLCGAKAVLLYSNLPVLAVLPIFTYCSDSIIMHLVRLPRWFRRDKPPLPLRLILVWLVLLLLALIVLEDYRLNVHALMFAVAGFSLDGLSKLIINAGPRMEKSAWRTWDSPLFIYLWAGILPILLAGYAAYKFENIVAASHIAKSWGFGAGALKFLPGIVLHILFNSTMNSAYPFSSNVDAASVLEDPTEQASDAIASTLQAGLWVIVFGVLGREVNVIDWLQGIAFALIYVVSVGPRYIGYYPPRMLNIILRMFRRRPLPIHSEPWQFPVTLLTTTVAFAILMSCNTMFWVDTVAYSHNAKTWLGPSNLIVDTTYRPPKVRSFDMIIAHSAGHPVSSIQQLVSSFTSVGSIRGAGPKITIYTKDKTLNISDTATLRGDFGGQLTVQVLPNIGGPTATILHHILYSWESLPTQTLFLTTSDTNSHLPLYRERLNTYYISPGFPLPDALPKSGFLNLGPQETCSCGSCFDSHGWEDTFHLVPSMFGAVRPQSSKCDSVLLTYGNNFVATAARIRGIKHDIWQLLYDALMQERIEYAWAHEEEKLPEMLPGEEGKGRWAHGEIYGEKDSLEKPYLGFTVERLWGILLQCSEAELAWRCPNLERGWRLGGERADCGCIE